MRQWSHQNYFASKTCNENFQRANATNIAYGENDPPDDWLKTGWARDSQTRTRLVDSLICITSSLENNAFSVQHYVMVALHYSMLHRFETFSAPRTIAHGSIRLPPRSLASSLGCLLAKNENITWSRIHCGVVISVSRRIEIWRDLKISCKFSLKMKVVLEDGN